MKKHKSKFEFRSVVITVWSGSPATCLCHVYATSLPSPFSCGPKPKPCISNMLVYKALLLISLIFIGQNCWPYKRDALYSLYSRLEDWSCNVRRPLWSNSADAKGVSFVVLLYTTFKNRPADRVSVIWSSDRWSFWLYFGYMVSGQSDFSTKFFGYTLRLKWM